MYLNYDQIIAFCKLGYMENWDESCINTASLDVRLGREIYFERYSESYKPLDYRSREKLHMSRVEMGDEGYVLRPGQFILAHTVEVCKFPDNVAALFRIKSSMGRIALEHMDAGWVDPGFNGALTLEFKNMTQYHDIRIRPGDRIGQLILLPGESVRSDKSYRNIGNYNGETGVAQIRYKE